jgi:hypothetical protein
MRRPGAAQRSVGSPTELLHALDEGYHDIRVVGTLQGMPSIRLPPGASLNGGRLMFGAKGLVLSSDNRLEDIEVICPSHEVAVGNTTNVADLGTLELRNLRAKGQVLLLAEGAARRGIVSINGLDVVEADLRGRAERPHGFGVDVMQGALTVWNRHEDPGVVIRAEIRGVSVGRAESPIRGSGIFVGVAATKTDRPSGAAWSSQCSKRRRWSWTAASRMALRT